MGEKAKLREKLKQKTKELEKIENLELENAGHLAELLASKYLYKSSERMGEWTAEYRKIKRKELSISLGKKHINRAITLINHELGDINAAEREAKSKDWNATFVQMARECLSSKKFDELKYITNKVVGEREV